MTPEISRDNWNYCRYRLGELLVYISYGAEANPAENGEIQEFFFVTLQNDEMEELFQKEFKTLDESLKFINETYHHWDFEDQIALQALPKDGCDSCQAH